MPKANRQSTERGLDALNSLRVTMTEEDRAEQIDFETKSVERGVKNMQRLIANPSVTLKTLRMVVEA